MRAQRLLDLMDRLRVRRSPVTAEDLAEELGISVRTVYRDILSLQSMGAPIRGERGLGYVLGPGAFLPPLVFDADEIDALALGLKLVRARGDTTLRAAAERVAGKLAGALPSSLRSQIADDGVLAHSTLPHRHPHLTILRRAIRQRRMLEIAYRSLEDQTTHRRIRPLAVTVFDAVWVLTAFCETRSDFRNFRIDRIDSVTEMAARFAVEPGREMADYLRSLNEQPADTPI